MMAIFKGSKHITLLLIKACLAALTALSAFGHLENPNCRGLKDVYSGHKYLYFTNISAYFTLMAYLAGIMYRSTDRIYSTYNLLLQMALSLETVTVVVFWCLYLVDKRLIKHPKSFIPGCETPILEELSAHVFPFVLVLIEQHDVPITRSQYLGPFIISIAATYYVATRVYAHYLGEYIYSFLGSMSESGRMLFFVSTAVILLMVYNAYARLRIKN